MAKRIVRIAPPAYICISLVLVQWVVVDHFIKHGAVNRLADLTGEQVIRNFSFSYSWMSPGWINPVFWTLAIEFQFYIIIGLLYNLLFEKKNVLAFVAFFIILTSLYLIGGFVKFSISGYSPMFAMGGAALLFKKELISVKKYFIILILFSAIMTNNFGYLSAIFGLSTSLIIAFVKIRHSIFSFFGKISYSLYLMHLLIGGTTEFLLSKVYHPHTEIGNLAAISFCIAVALLLSYGYYKVVEVPFMKIGR
ncbi:MAG: acyltransferase, partial [Hymenobacter sp.]